MPSAQAVPQFEAFTPYVDPFGAGQTARSLWLQGWRTGVETAVWWTERWLEALSVFAPAASAAPAVELPRPIAAVIDLAQIAASRIAADISEVAAPAVEIAETVIDAQVSIVQEAASVVEHAAVVAADLPDDLTRLVGIGPKLSVALAERGVTRFAHIAAWTEADLAEVDKALDLKGRAVRDAWIAQAKRFAAEA